MGAIYKYTTKVMDRLIGLSNIIGALSLIFAVVVILIDVIGRLMGMPLSGSQDLYSMAMVSIVFGGMALCDKQGGHVAVDIFEKSFSKKMNYWLDVLGWGLGAIIFFGIAYTVLESAEISKMLNLSTNVIGIPKAPFQYLLAAFSFLTGLSMTLRIIFSIISPGIEHQENQEEVL